MKRYLIFDPFSFLIDQFDYSASPTPSLKANAFFWEKKNHDGTCSVEYQEWIKKLTDDECPGICLHFNR